MEYLMAEGAPYAKERIECPFEDDGGTSGG